MKLRVALLLALLLEVFVALIVPAQKTQSLKLEPLSPNFPEIIGSDAKLEPSRPASVSRKGRCGIRRGFSTSATRRSTRFFESIRTARRKASSHWATRTAILSTAAIG